MVESTVLRKKKADFDLEQLNQQFEHAHPRKILAWCVANFPTGLVQTSTFNLEDLVITDILYRDLNPRLSVPILFLDTLHHFSETLELVVTVKNIYDLDLHVYRVTNLDSRTKFARKYGDALWQKDEQRFHHLTKTEPLIRGLTQLNALAWITGFRRDQTEYLANMPVFELDEQKRLKINPLANWTRVESWAYAYEHDLVYHPLHDQGYTQIGDEPLTVKRD